MTSIARSFTLLVTALLAAVSTNPNAGFVVVVEGFAGNPTQTSAFATHHRAVRSSSSTSLKDVERPEHVFISVKEAEEAIRLERETYQQERQAMREMMEEQRIQLEALQGRRRGNNSGKGTGIGVGIGVRIATAAAAAVAGGGRQHQPKAAASSLVEPDPVYGRINGNDLSSSSSSSAAPNTMLWRESNGSGSSNSNSARQQQQQLQDIEDRLKVVMHQNAQLLQQLHDQHDAHALERVEWEQRVYEERERMMHLQEELCMERAYFDTSRKLLEGLLEAEQKKVRALQDELYAREELYLFGQHEQRQQQFQHDFMHQHPGPHPSHEHRPHHGHPEHHNMDPRRRPANGRHSGLRMDNGIRAPLYP